MSLKLDIIKGVLLEEELTDESVIEFRKKKCSTCPYFRRDNETCMACGCFLEVKWYMLFNKNPAKLFRVEETHCVKGFWNDRDLANIYHERDGEPLV